MYKYLKDILVGEQVEQICYVQQVESKTTKNGKPFTRVTIKDRSGSMPVNIWQTNLADISDLKTGTYAVFKLKVEEYKGDKSAAAPPPMVVKAPEDLSPYQNKNGLSDDIVASYYQILIEAKNKIKNIYIRTYLDVVFDDPSNKALFIKAPASSSNRGAYRGGLVEHVAKVLINAQQLIASHRAGNLVANINEDIITAGVLMHDIGKMYAYVIDDNGSAKTTRQGMLLEHLPMSYAISSLAIEKTKALMHKDFPAEIADHINHCILAHHGQLAYGSPVIPKSLEAQIVHVADMADSTISNYAEPTRANSGNVDSDGFIDGTRFSSKQLFVGHAGDVSNNG